VFADHHLEASVLPPEPDPLLAIRAAVVLLLALLAGLLAAGLVHLTNDSVLVSALVGGSAAADALLLFDKVIERK
jgi:hypothetical protein